MSVNVGSAVGYLDLDIRGFLDGLHNAQAQADSASKSFIERFENTGKAFKDIGEEFSKYISLPIIGAFTASAYAAIDFESAFAGVRKTVDATEEVFAELSTGIREMSKVMPQSASAIAGVAEAAGQLGIKTENILDFSKTMVMLGDATNLSSEQAATALARFANITQMPQTEFDKLGSTIVALGNNLATTESEITNMGLRLAGAGKQVGMTEAQIMSFAGALSSVGIEAEAGGSAFSKVMMQMQLATETTGKITEILSSESFRASVNSLELAKAGEVLKEMQKEVADAQNKVADAQKRYNDELEKTDSLVSNALSAEENLKKAQDAYNDAIDKFGENSEQAVKAQERLDEAQRKYNASVVALGPNFIEAMNAQEKFTQAQDAYNAAVVEFGFGSKQALQAQEQLTQSQEEYNNVLLQSNTNSTDMQEAQWNLIDAQLNLLDTQDKLSESQDYYTNVASAGVQGTLRELEILADTNSKAFGELASDFGMTSEELKNLMGNSKDLENFSNVAGMTGEQFRQAFQEDATGALLAFIEGLQDAEQNGQSAIAVLDEMGITEVRMRDALLRAAGAGDVFRESLELGTKAWEENTALTNEAEQRYATMKSQLSILKNNLVDLGISIGEVLMPYLEKWMEWAKNAIEKFSGLSEGAKENIVFYGLIAAAIGPVLFAMGELIISITAIIGAFKTLDSLAAVKWIGTLASAIWTTAIPALGGFWTALTGPVGLAIIAIAAIGAAI